MTVAASERVLDGAFLSIPPVRSRGAFAAYSLFAPTVPVR